MSPVIVEVERNIKNVAVGRIDSMVKQITKCISAFSWTALRKFVFTKHLSQLVAKRTQYHIGQSGNSGGVILDSADCAFCLLHHTRFADSNLHLSENYDG